MKTYIHTAPAATGSRMFWIRDVRYYQFTNPGHRVNRMIPSSSTTYLNQWVPSESFGGGHSSVATNSERIQNLGPWVVGDAGKTYMRVWHPAKNPEALQNRHIYDQPAEVRVAPSQKLTGSYVLLIHAFKPNIIVYTYVLSKPRMSSWLTVAIGTEYKTKALSALAPTINFARPIQYVANIDERTKDGYKIATSNERVTTTSYSGDN
ncbi:hypothetical protein EDB83DRAFT_132703 [Lactarius deliciosus]|nr:hypothetical protein EDB83DRAFT_132703 [Lactarius deliciosus]